MKNNKGFTLAEILGVITILALLGIVVFPAVEKSLKESKQSLYDIQISNIESGARTWIAENVFSIPDKEGESITLTLSQLKQDGKVDENITNPKTKTLFPNDMLIVITKTRGNYDIDILTDTGTSTIDVEYNPLSPMIVLNGNILEYFEYDSSSINYVDKGAIASTSTGEVISNLIETEIKDYNGNVINNISSNNLGEYTITYSILDNDIVSKAIRTVIVKDTKAPIITVPSTTTISSSNASSYDLIGTVNVVDASEYTLTTDKTLTSVAGTYTITYTAIDIYGNTSIERRKIIVE